NGFWDYGPVGVELRNNIKNFWWERMVRLRDDVVGVDTSIICHPQTWVASGHLASFSDPMV
ncbi:MAG TPA: glycine--tRNA ligase, partial [Deltaproteobacteria bacterium]|nr:glycine--tRNA ligase [Deltaproteobacteria bacterium]